MKYLNSFINGRNLVKFSLPICIKVHFIVFLVTKDVSLQTIEGLSILTELLSPVPFNQKRAIMAEF